jgi:hypothetical protein
VLLTRSCEPVLEAVILPGGLVRLSDQSLARILEKTGLQFRGFDLGREG